MQEREVKYWLRGCSMYRCALPPEHGHHLPKHEEHRYKGGPYAEKISKIHVVWYGYLPENGGAVWTV